MSHPEQLQFFRLVAEANKSLVHMSDILEVGSYDVNGEVRELFSSCRNYTGVDLTPGPGVDIVGYGHELKFDDGSFDITLSAECFEHDPHWDRTFRNMVRMTRPGGLVAFTCASKGRPEHGTRRTTPANSPGTQSLGVDYYRNLNERDFSAIPLAEFFSDFRFWYLSTHFDLYFAGVRRGGHGGGQLPDGRAIQQIANLMPSLERTVRKPLQLASRVLPEGKYQTMIRPYWTGLRSLGTLVGKSTARE